MLSALLIAGLIFYLSVKLTGLVIEWLLDRFIEGRNIEAIILLPLIFIVFFFFLTALTLLVVIL